MLVVMHHGHISSRDSLKNPSRNGAIFYERCSSTDLGDPGRCDARVYLYKLLG